MDRMRTHPSSTVASTGESVARGERRAGLGSGGRFRAGERDPGREDENALQLPTPGWDVRHRVVAPVVDLLDLRLDAFVERASTLRIGASYDFGPEIGSLVSPDHRDRVASHVEDAVTKGATVLTGGRARPDLGPAFFEPTVLEGVTEDMLAGRTETFGPVVGLYRYRTVDEAIKLANDTEYGLNASVWSGDIARAEVVAERVDSGNVNINDALATAYASKATPSGGVKSSGVGARHGD